MVEGQPLVGDRLRLVGREGRVRASRALGSRAAVSLRPAEIGHDDDAAAALGSSAAISASLSELSMRLAGIVVAVGGDEAPSARSGRSGRARRAPRNRASTRTTPRRSRRRRASPRSPPACWAERRRPGRLADAGPRKACCSARHELVQFAARRAGAPTLSSPRKTSASPSSFRRSRFSAKFSVASGKKRAPGILSRVDETRAALVADDAAEVPKQVPERRRVVDRPGVQPVVVGQGPAAPILRLARETRHRQGVNSGRRPERLVVGCGQSLALQSGRRWAGNREIPCEMPDSFLSGSRLVVRFRHLRPAGSSSRANVGIKRTTI